MKAREAKPNDPSVYTTISGLLQPPGGLPEDDRGAQQGGRARAQQPAGLPARRDLLLGEGSKDHRLSDAQKKEYIEQGLENVEQGAAAESQLRRRADLQGPAVPPAGAGREGPERAAEAAGRRNGAPEAGDRDAEEDRGLLALGRTAATALSASDVSQAAGIPGGLLLVRRQPRLWPAAELRPAPHGALRGRSPGPHGRGQARTGERPCLGCAVCRDGVRCDKRKGRTREGPPFCVSPLRETAG